jgi:hypothetical protein
MHDYSLLFLTTVHLYLLQVFHMQCVKIKNASEVLTIYISTSELNRTLGFGHMEGLCKSPGILTLSTYMSEIISFYYFVKYEL